MSRFCSVGGGIHHTAIIGADPEYRDWTPDQPRYEPEIHPTARIHSYVTVDAGVRSHTTIGARSWLMTKVHVGHDALIGEDVEIAPGAVICGDVIICNGVHIGVNASVKHGVTVGGGAVIGAGAVVVKDVPAYETVVGNPARPLPVRVA